MRVWCSGCRPVVLGVAHPGGRPLGRAFVRGGLGAHDVSQRVLVERGFKSLGGGYPCGLAAAGGVFAVVADAAVGRLDTAFDHTQDISKCYVLGAHGKQMPSRCSSYATHHPRRTELANDLFDEFHGDASAVCKLGGRHGARGRRVLREIDEKSRGIVDCRGNPHGGLLLPAPNRFLAMSGTYDGFSIRINLYQIELV